ncbi:MULTISPECIES: type II toxin-antitoxin system RelE/ParE family toxin [Pseudomonas]
MGGKDRVRTTREWAVPNWSYLIPYRVRGDRLQILGVFHSRCPPVPSGDNKLPETKKTSYFYEGFVLYGGTRRTVCFGETRFFGRLEFAGKFGVPQLVTINKSASYGVRWNRTRDF